MQPEFSVLVLPCLDPTFGRIEARAVPGTSIAEMIALTMPSITAAQRARLRVTMGEFAILPGLWGAVKPKAGAQVMIRAVAGDELLRTALNIAVTVAAVAAGQFYAPALLGAIGVGATATTTAFASAAISATTLLAGTLLINALVPPRTDAKDKPSYSIQGLRNQLTPDGMIPLILGFVRYAPPYAAIPYTQAVGDDRYVIAAFCCGYGPVGMSNWRIGDTPIERYSDVNLETRAGYAGDDRLALYPRQMIEKPLTIELKTAILPTGGPQIRTTAADCIGCEIDTTYPGGVFGTNKDGGNVPFTVIITTRFRLSGSGDDAWVGGPAISVTAKKPGAITRTTPITFPVRGRYEVELTRITPDWDEADQSKKDIRRSGRSAWSAIRSIRPEYPINFGKPLALAACRIRASGQLNGTLDDLNADMRSICPDWDAPTGTWVTRETNNPASLFRYVLTGPAITYPLDEDEIAALGDWHAFCAAKGLTYNRVHDYEASVLDVLSDIAAAGRASPQDGGTAWGVVVDRALDTVTAHISPSNSWGFSGERPYVVFPDAFRVTFLDETNGFAKAERIVPWPGFEGEVKVTEKLDLPGITNPDLVWKEARRRQYELIERRDTYTVNQDAEHMAVARGDRAQLSHDVLDRVQVSARVEAVQGQCIYLNDHVTFVAGQTYACRFRRDDGSSVLRNVKGSGTTQLVNLTGAGDLPGVGNLAFFGPSSRESFACTVKGVEALENFAARLTLVDHAPEIEALVDAEVPPIWSGRAGAEAQIVVGTPLPPLVTDVVSGRQASDVATADNPYPVVVLIQASGLNATSLSTFQVQHRRSGIAAWSVASGSVAAGAVLLPGYAKGDAVEIQARSVSDQGTPSVWTTSVIHTVAATDPAAPVSPSAVSATSPGAGAVHVAFTTSGSPQAAASQVYVARGVSALFATATKAGAVINGGPGTPQTADITGLAADTWRVWVTALDSDGPPNESAPSAPANVVVT